MATTRVRGLGDPGLGRDPRRPVRRAAARHGRHRQGVRPGDGRVVRRDRRPRTRPDRASTRASCRRCGPVTPSASSPTTRARRSSPSDRSSSCSPAARRCTPTWATSGCDRSVMSWYSWVLPALLLNYFGQAALLRDDPAAIESPFYRLAPDWAITPLAVLATMATVIASQALISGRLLADRPGDQPRLHPAADGSAHVGRPRRADLRAARQLAADDRLRRAGARLPVVERPRRRLRHRRHRDDDDHDAAVLPGRPRPLRLVDDQGVADPHAAAASST